MRALLKPSSGRRRLFAAGCVLLLLLVQSLAAAHFHQAAVPRGYSHTASSVDPLCAVCLFDLHCPTQLATPVVVPRLTPIYHTTLVIAAAPPPIGPAVAPVSRG